MSKGQLHFLLIHDVATTSFNVAATSRHCNDVETTLLGRCVFAGGRILILYIC